jgi:dienelactone hydrolase
MGIRTRTVDYADDGEQFEAFMAWDDGAGSARPGVLVAHAWRGRGEQEAAKAKQLAELGYVGFALDLFGKGVRGGSIEENRRLIRPFMDDRRLLAQRMQLALSVMRSQVETDESRTAAIGFCFGGLCVLDLARSGADVDGVVSFHGLFEPPGHSRGNRIGAKVLVLHGWDDPMATPGQLVDLGRELTEMKADWQIHAYGNAMHAFTNPAANDPDFGTVYQPDADRRAWQSMRSFLEELFPRP